MNSPLESQIRDYFAVVDEQQGAVDLDSVARARVHDLPSATVGRSPRWPNRRRLAAVAAGVVLLAVLGSRLLTGSDGPDTSTNTPTTDPPTTTVAPAGDAFPQGSWLFSVAASDSLLVAVGTDVAVCCGSGVDGVPAENASAAVWTSTDGESWFRVPHDESVFGGPGGQSMLAVTATPDGFVAVGIDSGRTQSDGAIWTSPDGLAWARVPDPDDVLGGPTQQQLNSVAYSSGILVAFGFDEQYVERGIDGATIWTSVDGSEWTEIGPPSGPDEDASLVAIPSGFLAFDSAAVWASADGASWTRDESLSPLPDGVSELSLAEGDYVGIDMDRTRFWRSIDGAAWAIDSEIGELADAGRVEAITAFQGALLGVGLSSERTSDDYHAVAGRIPVFEPPVVTSDESAAAEEVTVDTPLGAIRWTKLEGTPESLPDGFSAVEDGPGYFQREGDRLWQSDDAITWTTSERPEPTTLAIDLPDPVLPDIGGLVWDTQDNVLAEADGVRLFSTMSSARIPWENYYGTLLRQGFDGPNTPVLNQASQTLSFFDSNGDLLAELRPEVRENRVVYTDVDTGVVVHEVVGTDEYPPARLVTSGEQGAPVLELASLWVSTDGSPVESLPVPWAEPGFLNVRGGVRRPSSGGFEVFADFDDGSVRAWTSQDGIAWVDHGSPTFLDDVIGLEDWFVTQWIDGLRAEVGMDAEYQAWQSTDGIEWTPAQTTIVIGSHVVETDFGYVATGQREGVIGGLADGEGAERFEFWFSTDGESWQLVEGPPGPHIPNGGGSANANAAGDLLYVAVEEAGISRVLWVGRFDP